VIGNENVNENEKIPVVSSQHLVFSIFIFIFITCISFCKIKKIFLKQTKNQSLITSHQSASQ